MFLSVINAIVEKQEGIALGDLCRRFSIRKKYWRRNTRIKITSSKQKNKWLRA